MIAFKKVETIYKLLSKSLLKTVTIRSQLCQSIHVSKISSKQDSSIKHFNELIN
jgi:hypothetical protein